MTQTTENRTAQAVVAISATGGSRLHVEDAIIGYDERVINEDLSVRIFDEPFTVIVGRNACGKLALLLGPSRLLNRSADWMIADGTGLHSFKVKEVTQRVRLLPQTSIAPDWIMVADLVARGRYRYQKLIRQWTDADEHAAPHAMDVAAVTDLPGGLMDELSAGKRQRVRVVRVLAQATDLLRLDEPATFLDITHPIELQELFTRLNHAGRALAAVLHDLNHAARYRTHLITMKDDQIVTKGASDQIVVAELVEEVFGPRFLVAPDPVAGTAQVVQLGRGRERPWASR
ncbi:MAG: ATP-binding cassette domain-containing protein [Micrococcaceae bacterium]